MFAERPGVLDQTLENLAGQARALSHFLGSASAGAVGALPAPVRNLAAGLLASLDQLPPVAGELDVLVAEVHAKRLSVQALESELAALDEQLELFERSLAPVQAWSNQLGKLRTALTDVLVEAPEEKPEEG